LEVYQIISYTRPLDQDRRVKDLHSNLDLQHQPATKYYLEHRDLFDMLWVCPTKSGPNARNDANVDASWTRYSNVDVSRWYGTVDPNVNLFRLRTLNWILGRYYTVNLVHESRATHAPEVRPLNSQGAREPCLASRTFLAGVI
jgi:hypothetical protein